MPPKNELTTALEDLAHPSYNMTSPHPEEDRINRPAAVALAAFDLGMHVDEVRDAASDAMNGRHNQNGQPAPFPDDEKRIVLDRIQDMLGMLSYLERKGFTFTSFTLEP